MSLPTDSKARKEIPITRGVLDFFPDAIAYVAKVSKYGSDKHNPGEPMRWSREKSNDHADCIARHLMERGTIDGDGLRHSGMLAWRALALLQLEIEAANDCSVMAKTAISAPLPPPGPVVPVSSEAPEYRIPPAPELDE